MKHFLTVIINIVLCAGAIAQQKQPSKLPAWLIQPSLAYQFPGGDLAERFGDNFSLGIGAGYKTTTDWIFALDFQFMFGNNVKDAAGLLSPVISEHGYIFNRIGNYADVAISQRGLYGTADVSKTLGFMKVNQNSGPSLQFGAGYIAHWVAISEVENNAPQLLDEYKKGYDELSGGLLLKQSIGYLYLSRNRRVNFRLSFEVMQAFTQNLRGFSYSTGKAVTEPKLDLLYGIRLQWILPIYTEAREDYFYD